jgi:hypothetical protein
VSACYETVAAAAASSGRIALEASVALDLLVGESADELSRLGMILTHVLARPSGSGGLGSSPEIGRPCEEGWALRAHPLRRGGRPTALRVLALAPLGLRVLGLPDHPIIA